MIRWANGNNQEPWRLCFILRKHFSIYKVKIHHLKREATHLADRQANLGVRLSRARTYNITVMSGTFQPIKL